MVRSKLQLVEEQILRWRLEQQQRAERPARKVTPSPHIIVISNAYGSGGIPIGERTAELLGVPVYDREVLHHIATSARVRLETVETLDEHAQSRLDDVITGLFRDRSFYRSDFSQALTRTVLGLWQHGRCVIIGHGSSHIVPRTHALVVRVTAPAADRAAYVRQLENLPNIEAAMRRVERVDAERRAFVRQYFNVAIDSPLAYDMIVNSSAFGVDAAAHVLIEAYRRKFPEEQLDNPSS